MTDKKEWESNKGWRRKGNKNLKGDAEKEQRLFCLWSLTGCALVII
jgi:hypothetical protein